MIKTLYEKFQHWSQNGSIYIISDLHLGDNDCKLMSADWITPEMQINLINSIVHKNDTFVCLGDIGDPKYISKINARYKVLILGNHDRRSDYKDIFNEIYSGALFIADRILLSHEPIDGLTWCLNIHGHDHSNMESYSEGCRHLNLAANVCNYTPINLGEIIKKGILSNIKTIHREAIDKQKMKKEFHNEYNEN